MKLRWRIAWLATYPFARLFLHLQVLGRDRLCKGAQIIAANHVSNADPLILGWAAARELHFLAKAELFQASRFFSWLIRSWNAWPVRRGMADPAALKHCEQILRSGNTLVLFPEGSRSPTGEIRPFKPGVGMLALKTGVPVVPALISGLEHSWVSYLADKDFVRKGFRRRPHGCSPIRVFFDEPLHPETIRNALALQSDVRSDRQIKGHSIPYDRTAYETLTQQVESRIRNMTAKLKAQNGMADISCSPCKHKTAE